MQYSNNLIGKHFKTLSQTMAFHLHSGLASPKQLKLVCSVAHLGSLLWHSELTNETIVSAQCTFFSLLFSGITY
jgi:hypothetical protein